MYRHIDVIWTKIEPKWHYFCKKCNRFIITVSALLLVVLLICLSLNFTLTIHVVIITPSLTPKFVTSDKFLSVALDTSIIANNLRHYHLRNLKFLKLVQPLSPAYLRVGGTMADRLTFTMTHFYGSNYMNEFDGDVCSYEGDNCSPKPELFMTKNDWLLLNDVAVETQLDLIFGLNALKRFDDQEWDPQNAMKLIAFSAGRNLNVNWELGNEPNSFSHQFNYTVTPQQLSEDFTILKSILEQFPIYSNSLLLGPDVTRPDPNSNASEIFLREFLQNIEVLNAITWHQYYFNGATAKISDFLNLDNFNILQWQLNVVKQMVDSSNGTKEIWLGETGSAYGGGAPQLSDRFLASFLWLDKLGLAAKNGISVIIRQSLFRGNYALIDEFYQPTPDWWVSILYKKLVSPKVIDCQVTSQNIRIYCHCTNPKSYFKGERSITVFGINLNDHFGRIRFEGIPTSEAFAYILRSNHKINSRFIYLNKKLLKLTEDDEVPEMEPKLIKLRSYIEMPGYSIGFWVLPVPNDIFPYC